MVIYGQCEASHTRKSKVQKFFQSWQNSNNSLQREVILFDFVIIITVTARQNVDQLVFLFDFVICVYEWREVVFGSDSLRTQNCRYCVKESYQKTEMEGPFQEPEVICCHWNPPTCSTRHSVKISTLTNAKSLNLTLKYCAWLYLQLLTLNVLYHFSITRPCLASSWKDNQV